MYHKKRGQAAILMTMCLVGIISLLAVVVDTGRIYVEHTKLQKAVDSAVLAAAQELPPGKNLTESDIKDIVYKALDYNLNTSEITITKKDNVTDYLLPSDEVKEEVTIKKDKYTIEDAAVDIQFLVPADAIEKQETVISVTIHKRLETRLSTILGYNEWTISAQRIARNGPIGSVPEFLPIAIVSKMDVNNMPKKIPYRTTIRLSNTTHSISSTHPLYEYVPIATFNGITSLNGVAEKFLNGVTGSSIKISNTPNVIETRIKNREDSMRLFSSMCSGLEQRLTEGKVGAGTIGCINSDEVILAGERPYNITSVDTNYRFSYGDDPRLVLLPIVQTTNGTYNTLSTRQRSFKIIGFAMFYIQYAHYTSYPPGGELYENGESVAMTELVGFFTDSIIEGPIAPEGFDYGLTGVQFVDPNDEEVFDIHI